MNTQTTAEVAMFFFAASFEYASSLGLESRGAKFGGIAAYIAWVLAVLVQPDVAPTTGRCLYNRTVLVQQDGACTTGRCLYNRTVLVQQDGACTTGRCLYNRTVLVQALCFQEPCWREPMLYKH